MSYAIKLKVWGERACFSRPEMKVERVSYDLMTPSAARGIVEAIFWKPEIRWVIDRVHVLKPIRFQSFRRNEVGSKASVSLAKRAIAAGRAVGLGINVEENRQQRATTLLIDVAYIIEAHLVLTSRASSEDKPAKYLSMFRRRAAAGQCFHRPCLGVREFPADFELIADDAPLPASSLPLGDRNKDFGWMLHDIDFVNGNTARFLRARLTDGVLEVAKCRDEGAA